jgi:hypothetical protein
MVCVPFPSRLMNLRLVNTIGPVGSVLRSSSRAVTGFLLSRVVRRVMEAKIWLVYSVIAKTGGNAKRARFGCFCGQGCFRWEGSKDNFESDIPSTTSVHAVHAKGPLGSPLSAEPFQNSGDGRRGTADTRLSLSSGTIWICLGRGIADAGLVRTNVG